MTSYSLRHSLSVALAATAVVVSLGAAQPALVVNNDDINIHACISRVNIQATPPSPMLIWSRSDIMLAGISAAAADAPSPVGTSGVAGRVFYWLDDDEDLSKYVGQMVEIDGKLEDFEQGEIEVKRAGDFTEIELELEGRQEKARVPTAWLGGLSSDKDQEFDFVARRINVEDVRVRGACNELR